MFPSRQSAMAAIRSLDAPREPFPCVDDRPGGMLRSELTRSHDADPPGHGLSENDCGQESDRADDHGGHDPEKGPVGGVPSLATLTGQRGRGGLGVPVAWGARWPATLAVVIALAIYLQLPDRLTPGPQFLAPVRELALVVPLGVTSPTPDDAHAPTFIASPFSGSSDSR